MVFEWNGFHVSQDNINVMVFTGAVTGVVRIQTSGAIWVGREVAEALHICNEHFEVIIHPCSLHIKLLYTMGGFANGWKDVVMLQNWPFAFLAGLKLCSGECHCHGCILGDSKIFGIYIIAS